MLMPDANKDLDKEFKTIEILNNSLIKFKLRKNVRKLCIDCIVKSLEYNMDIGYVEIENGFRTAEEENRIYKCHSFLMKKFFYSNETENILIGKIKPNLDRSIYIRTSSDFKNWSAENMKTIIDKGIISSRSGSSQNIQKHTGEELSSRQKMYIELPLYSIPHTFDNVIEFLVESFTKWKNNIYS